MQTKHLCVLIQIWTKGAPINRFKPSSKIFYWPFQGSISFVDLLWFFLYFVCYAFVRVCLYVPGIGLTSRLSFVVSYCEFVILGQVWYLIVSIPDICTLTFYYSTSIICLQILLPAWPIITLPTYSYNYKLHWKLLHCFMIYGSAVAQW